MPAAAVVGEAMVALTLADALVEKFGGDSQRRAAPLGATRWTAEVGERLRTAQKARPDEA